MSCYTLKPIYMLKLPKEVMALLQQPTEQRMISTFLTAYVCGNIVSRDRYA